MKKSIWLELKIVLPVVILCVLIAMASAAFITQNSPSMYTASTKLQIGGLLNYTLPGSISSRPQGTNAYAELANDPLFSKLVIKEVGPKFSKQIPEFEVNVKPIEDTDMLEVSVETSDARVAKVLADTSAKALILKSAELKGSSFGAINSVISVALRPVDKDLVKLRGKLFDIQGTVEKPASAKDKIREGLLSDQIATKSRQRAEMANKATPSELKKLDEHLAVLRSKLFMLQQKTNETMIDKKPTIEAEALGDKITDKESFRRSLTDYLARAALNNLFEKQDVLRVVYSAEVPDKPSSPSWPRNLSVALLAGLFVSLVGISLADPFYKLRDKE